MQNYKSIKSNDYMSRSREVLNNNFESIASNFSGAMFPSVNLVAYMTCYRTDQNKLYRLQEDLITWKLEVDYSSGVPVINSSINSDEAKKANELTAEHIRSIDVTSDEEGIEVTSVEDGVVSKRSINLQPKYAELLDFFYPVGHILVTSSSINPSERMGGTWQQLPEGTFLVAAGNSAKYRQGVTGGEAEHTLTVDELPSHNHTGSTSNAGTHTHTRGTMNITGFSGGAGGQGDNIGAYDNNGVWSPSGAFYAGGTFRAGRKDGRNTSSVYFDASRAWTGSTSNNGDHNHSVSVSNTGGGKAHNNLPPYLAMYMWQRIA